MNDKRYIPNIGSTSSRFLAVAVLVGCGAVRDRADPSADRDVATQHAALMASGSLAAALSGKIQPITTAPGNLISSGMPGSPRVGEDGSANYHLPIWVPDGVNGLQPVLSVDYNSESGVSTLGPRWRLSGLSVIVRCGKTRAQDGAQTKVDFFGDTFCLDGERLIRLSSTGLEFRTEHESFTKIVATTNISGDFTTFTAYQRDGRIFHYGSVLANRLHGNPIGAASARDVSYAYYLDKIEDRYGNAIAISYSPGVPNPSKNVSQAQELVPTVMTWGPATPLAGDGPARSIIFTYEPLPAGAAINPQLRYVNGFGIGAAQYLSKLTTRGPNDAGAVGVLKEYRFEYTATPLTSSGLPLITGRRVLSKISECDANGVCKKPTVIQWQPGSTTYSKTQLISVGGFPAYVGPDDAASRQALGRLITTDLDGDGHDDIVYRRSDLPPYMNNTDFLCAQWAVRRTTHDATGNMVLTAPSSLPLGTDPDPNCTSPASNAIPKPLDLGDILIVDLNKDGYPDIVSPIGKTVGATQFTNLPSTTLAGFRVYLNKGVTAPATFGKPINFLDSIGQLPLTPNYGSSKDGMIGIGDIDGDGLLDIVRPVDNPPHNLNVATVSTESGLTAKSQSYNGFTVPYLECTSTIAKCSRTLRTATFPDGSTAIGELAVLDLDGDGIAEVVRNAPACAGMACDPMNSVAIATSVTFPANKAIPMPATSTTINGTSRWFLDLNGDGLLDIAWKNAPGDPRVFTSLNTGQSFTAPVITSLPANASLPDPNWGNRYADFGASLAASVRVVDLNLDGRQDLLLIYTWSSSSGTTQNPNMKALISDGMGKFTVQDVAVPVPNGNSLFRTTDGDLFNPILEYSYSPVQVADMNGDGLPDIVNVDGGGLGVYVRDGAPPELVEGITEGNGRTVSFGYDVASDKDPNFYAPDPALTCKVDPTRLTCLNRARWLVRSLQVGGPDIPVPIRQQFTYFGGLINKDGRGFLGFTKRDVYGPDSRHTTITYDPMSRVTHGTSYVYPYAMLPSNVRTDVDTWRGTYSHIYTYRSNGYTPTASVWQGASYNATLTASDTSTYDCATSSGATCTSASSTRWLAYETETIGQDAYGNVTNHQTSHYTIGQAGSYTLLQSDSEVTSYTHSATDVNNWLLSQLDPAVPATRKSTTATETVTRTIKFTPDSVHGGITSMEIEPGGTGATHLLRTFSRDAMGRLTTITDADFNGNPQRSTTYKYEDADGIYVTTTTTAGQSTRTWRHPGLGVVVEIDDPNGLAQTRSYDTFGRPLTDTAISGATTTTSYQDGPAAGLDITITPGATAARTRHFDSFGRQTAQSEPIATGRVLSESISYNEFGPFDHTTMSGPPNNPTTLNSHSFTYDDMGRLVSDCHMTSDWTNHCRTMTYDGLAMTTTDESGRAVTTTADAMGRLSIQQTTLQVGSQVSQIPISSVQTDATFTYGPFGVLEHEKVSDGSGQTDLAYDPLGRRTSVTRAGAGARGTVYNAFGDVIETYKGTSEPTGVDKLTFGRDGLGRITSITGSGMNRTFFWDAPAATPTTPAPYAIGKLVDVKDGTSTQVHHDYGSNGLLSKKTWSAAVWSSPLTEVGSAGYQYDTQGRLSKLTYPKPVDWTRPLAVAYAYDFNTGQASSLSDADNPSTTFWTTTVRDARGEVAGEAMGLSGGPTINRSASYNRATGLLESAGIANGDSSTATAFVNLGITYDAAGLPASVQESGPAIGVWTSSFTHDNLGRITRWGTGQCCKGYDLGVGYFDVGVSYFYDADGNLTDRQWGAPSGAGALQYRMTGNAGGAYTRTVSFGGTGGASYVDSYQADQWGRIFDTPAIAIAYNAADEVMTVTEKANGQSDALYRDGFGGRLAAAYGNPSTGQPWTLLYTFDDLSEIRRSSSGAVEERGRLRANGKLIGEITRTSNGAPRSATFYLTDNVGSVIAEASFAGSVTARARRDPFGGRIADSLFPDLLGEPAAANQDGSGRLGYGDHPRENKWGLVDMGARLYSPRLGRFIAPDAVIARAFDRRDHNPFAYAWNRPDEMMDPTGYASEGTVVPPPIDVPPGSGAGGPGFVPDSGGSGRANSGGCRNCNYVNVVSRPDGRAASASLTSTNGLQLAAPASDGFISVLKDLRLGTGVAAFAIENFINPNLITHVLPGWPGGGFRYIGLGGTAFNESDTLFRLIDRAPMNLKMGNRLISAFMTGWYGAEMVDMISQGRRVDAIEAGSHIVGAWVPGWNFVFEGMAKIPEGAKQYVTPVTFSSMPPRRFCGTDTPAIDFGSWQESSNQLAKPYNWRDHIEVTPLP